MRGGGGGGGGPGWGKGAPRMGKGVPFNSQIQLRWMGEGGGGNSIRFWLCSGGGFAVCFRLTQPVGSMGAHVSTHTEYLNFYYSVVRGGGGGGGHSVLKGEGSGMPPPPWGHPCS